MPKGSRVLMADDDKMLIDMYKERLELAGYVVTLSRNGEEALGKIREEKPDIVLLDIMMPKVNGYEALASIKSDPATKDIPVIMLSALMRDFNREKAVEAGADDYLIKSEAMPADVITKIEQVLAKYSKTAIPTPSEGLPSSIPAPSATPPGPAVTSSSPLPDLPPSPPIESSGSSVPAPPATSASVPDISQADKIVFTPTNLEKSKEEDKSEKKTEVGENKKAEKTDFEEVPVVKINPPIASQAQSIIATSTLPWENDQAINHAAGSEKTEPKERSVAPVVLMVVIAILLTTLINDLIIYFFFFANR